VNALLPHETKKVDEADFDKLDKPEDIIEYLTNLLHTEHRLKEEELPDPKILREVEKNILLRVV
ncbi:hypothetical protein GWN26_11260, partial [Candidatus Saccharibacteria bacterium]|nr:hypothetical protein [Candidatus Saccharibacteria bacterium]NIV03989.1 hypothetical protein [Calditrichia bacterium]NIV72356.1 hypothetical protein [Calditrichia bacterium]NIV99662.1 hypothetical protein [Candidatus Saccharibacteria bacterium]